MKGWFVAGSHREEYEIGVDPEVKFEGKRAGFLKFDEDNETASGFGTLMQMFQARDYAGKRWRFSAAVRTHEVGDWAGLWMRVDVKKEGESLAFDNMRDRAISGTTDWQQHTVVLDVAKEATHVAFGVLLSGKGKVWLSDVKFEEVGTDIPTTDGNSYATGYAPRAENLDFSDA